MESRDDSLRPVRIVKEFNGGLELDEDGIHRISNLLGGDFSDEVIILSIVGPPESGKSCFLNLMLTYLQSEGKGDWCKDLVNKKQPLKGLHTRDRKHPEDLSGIYCWPELLTLTASTSSEEQTNLPNNDGKKVPVLLMDSFFKEKGGGSGLMDMFLCMVSSKVIINSVQDIHIDDLRPLKIVLQKYKEHCNQISFLIRDSSTTYGQSKALSEAKKCLKSSLKTEDFDNLIQEVHFSEACFIKRPETIPICDTLGFLQNVDSTFVRSFKTLMNTLLDPDSLINGARKFADFATFLSECSRYSTTLLTELEEWKSNDASATAQQSALLINVDEKLPTSNVENSMEDNPTLNDNLFPPPDTILEMERSEMEMDDQVQIDPKIPKALSKSRVSEKDILSKEFQSVEKVNTHKEISKTHYGSCDSTPDHKKGFCDPNPNDSTWSSTYHDLGTKYKSTVNIFLDSEPEASPNLSFGSACNIQPNATEKLNDFSFKQTKETSTPAGKALCEARVITLLGAHKSRYQKCTSATELQDNRNKLDLEALLHMMDFLKTEFGAEETDSFTKSIMEHLRQALSQQYHSAEEDLLLTLTKQNEYEMKNSAKQEKIEAFEQSGILSGKGTTKFCTRSKDYTTSHFSATFGNHSKIQRETSHELLVQKNFQEFQSSTQSVRTLYTPESRSYAETLKNGSTCVPRQSLCSSANKLQNSTHTSHEDMDCSDSNVSQPVIENPIILEAQGLTPMDVDEEKNNPTEAHQKVFDLLRHYKDQLNSFAENINKYCPTSTQQIQNQIDKLSICLSVQEQMKLEYPEYKMDNNLSSKVQEINTSVLQKLNLAQEDYESYLNSLYRKLEHATTVMTSDIITGRSFRSPTSMSLEVLNEHLSTVPQMRQDLIQKMLKRDTSTFLSDMTCLEKALITYKTQMVRKFDMYKCMSPSLFSRSHQESYAAAQAEFKSDLPFFREQLEKCVIRMQNSLNRSNQNILQSEKDLVSEIAQKELWIRNFYNEMMTEFTSTDLWTSSQLKDIHEIVAGEILEAYKEACNFHSDSGIDIQKHSEAVQTELNSVFGTFQQKNRMRSEKLADIVNKAIGNHKMRYNYLMEELLKKNEGPTDPHELKRHHETFLKGVCDGLKSELTKTKGLRGSSSHLKTLKSTIESDWADFKEENEKKLKQKKEQELQSHRNPTKEKLQEPQRLEGPKFSESGTSTFSTVDPTFHTEQSRVTQQISTQILTPMAIELGFYFIRVGRFNPDSQKFQILNNNWGEQSTPTVLALTKNNEFLVGSEAIERQDNQLKWIYSLASLLESKQPSFKYDHLGLQETTKELLMGVLLSKIKEGVEKQLQGRWETVVLTVPLHYSSVNRQSTRDAATIAGFKNIHLVNDTSAAAMSYASFLAKGSREKKMVLVGVCTDSNFDAAVYELTSGHVKMESSCGSTHGTILQTHQNPVLSLVKGVISAGHQLLYGKEEKSAAERKLKDMVGELKKHITNCVCINASPESNSCYREIAPLLKRQCLESVFYSDEKLNIITGAAVIASLLCPQSNDSQQQLLMSKIVQDKLTYSFDVFCGKKSYPLIECKLPLIKPTAVGRFLTREITLGLNETSATVKESSNPVGNITFVHPEGSGGVGLRGTVNNEGILKVGLFTGPKSQRQHLHFTYHSSNMKTTEVKYMAEYVQSLQGQSKENKLLEQTRNTLQELMNELTPKLYNLTGMKQVILTKSINDAAATVNHPKSTTIMLETKVEHLKTLRSKYNV